MSSKVAARAIDDRIILKMDGHSSQGTVVSMGENCVHVNIDDQVIIASATFKVTIDGHPYVIAKESDVLCVLDKKPSA